MSFLSFDSETLKTYGLYALILAAVGLVIFFIVKSMRDRYEDGTSEEFLGLFGNKNEDYSDDDSDSDSDDDSTDEEGFTDDDSDEDDSDEDDSDDSDDEGFTDDDSDDSDDSDDDDDDNDDDESYE